MENQQNQMAQQNVEHNQQRNIFFEHVKEVIAKEKEKNNTSMFNIDIDSEIDSLSKKQIEMLGIFSFIMGIDYTGQHYLQRSVLTNVKKRLDEVGINEADLNEYSKIMNYIFGLDAEKRNELFEDVYDKVRNKLTQKVGVQKEEVLLLRNMKMKLNKMLDKCIIPIGFSSGVIEIKKNDITYENILKSNSLIQEQSHFSGNDIKSLIELYSDNMFNSLLKKSETIFNEAKFFTLYEESIQSVLESMKRFKLTFTPDAISEEEEKEAKEKFQKELEEKEKETETETENENVYKPKRFAGEMVNDLMQNRPDEFIQLSIEDAHADFLKSIDDVIDGIEKLCKNTDYIQHIYAYMAKNLNNSNRVIGETFLPESIKVMELVEALNNKVSEFDAQYKELAEINCAQIPEDMISRIVNYVDETIKACIIETTDQKQYLVSQLIENGISTWNHLQQMISIIETCKINASEASTYVNLYDYTREKSNIVEVFENAGKLNDIQVKMSVFRSFREWYKKHLPITENK